jgi:tetratricopeptide (TPR) repeat protein
MTDQATAGARDLSLDDWKQIDAECDRFESEWRSGQRPDLATIVDSNSEPMRTTLLAELLSLELEFLRECGESPDAASYRDRFPGHRAIIDAAFAPTRLAGRPSGSSEGTDGGGGSRDATVHGLGSDLPAAALGPAALGALREAGYEILGELGRGGMGVVYLARKLALDRPCALKMILAGPHAGSKAAARFRAEASAVARLRHPDIVQIYHVGEADGLPYIELEYLPGGSLDRTLDGTPRPPADAARLVEILARAIAEAHRRGIVHRDLKPGNVLLDADGRPKVADFGLAKFLDSDDGLTRTRAILGSPSYMAPEQAEGDTRAVGAAADVYSLGALLYVLLCGRPPFRGASELETLQQVKTAEPVPPSRLVPGLPRDVETIALKCLNKAPSRRYASAEALAEDLRRFLAREPILARPLPPWERAWKWARRRPTAAASLAVGAAALLLLFGGGLYYNARLRAAVKRAQAAEASALDQRNIALRVLKGLVDDVREKLGSGPATRAAKQSLRNTAIAGLEELARSAEASAPDQSRAVAHQMLGDTYRQLGRSDDARRQYEQARRLAEDLAVATPDHLAIAECLRGTYLGLGELGIRSENFAAAEEDFRRVVDLAEAIEAADPGRVGARRGRLEAYFELGRALAFAHKYGEADVWFWKMHDLAERWIVDEPGNTRAKDLLATSYRKLADSRKLSGDPDAAREAYIKGIAIAREVLDAEPASEEYQQHLAIALHDLAGVEYGRRRLAEARPLLVEAERRFAQLVAADPEGLDDQIWLVLAQRDFAKLDRDEGQFARALDRFDQALRRMRRLEKEGRLEDRPRSFKERTITELERGVDDCKKRLQGSSKP